jgi:hypothetical protein
LRQTSSAKKSPVSHPTSTSEAHSSQVADEAET